MPNSGDAEFRLAHPPVRMVELTLYFAPLAELRVTSVAGFVEELTGTYSTVTERFARGPWDEDTLPAAYYPEEGEFPFPWLSFSDDAGHSIGFQSDRLSISWEFDDGREYDGFETLKAQLEEKFQSFSALAAEVLGAPPQVLLARADYLNDFDTLTPLEIGAQALGAKVSNANVSGGTVPTRSAFHADLPVKVSDGISTVVELHAIRIDDDSSLLIRADARADKDTSQPFLRLLESAHDSLIESFKSIATQNQLDEWNSPS